MSQAFGQFLKERRTARKWTLRELASRAGVGFATLSRWESGAFLPRLPELEAVLEALGVLPAERIQALRWVNAPRAAQQLREEPRVARLEEELGTIPNGGDLLRAMRYRRGLFLEQVAAALRVSPGTVSRWEQGKVIPPPERRDALFALLDAGPHERAALSSGTLFLQTPLRETRLTRETLEQQIAELWNTPQTPIEFQTRELLFLSLRAQCWPVAARETWARRCLGQLDTQYAHFLSCQSRHAEAKRCADRALDLMPEKRRPERFQMLAGFVAARSAVHGGAKPKGRLGVEQLRHWLSVANTPEMATWIRADMATYLALDGVMEGALRLLEEATLIAEDSADEEEKQLRKLDKARLLMKASRPAEALPLIDAEATADPWMRTNFLLARVPVLLALNDRTAAQEELRRAQSHIETYHLVHMRQDMEILAQRF
jgi:transcriptional regulator with XRE-family HTH domain